ncbi:MAG: hypothetical protein K2M06_09260 [Muribaculaceae bacterium]|nr:hypothetical protein [Muribaculaceae bacterium]
MPGKDYSEQAYHISMQLDDLVKASKENWQDEQAKRFGYNHIEPISTALREIQLPIEKIIDLVDTKLHEIQKIANGNKF